MPPLFFLVLVLLALFLLLLLLLAVLAAIRLELPLRAGTRLLDPDWRAPAFAWRAEPAAVVRRDELRAEAAGLARDEEEFVEREAWVDMGAQRIASATGAVAEWVSGACCVAHVRAEKHA